MEDGDSNNAIRLQSNTMKTATNLNGTTVFVKGYNASVRIHVETPNARSFNSAPYHQRIIPNHGIINRLLWIPLRRNNYPSLVNGLAENDNATIHNNGFLERL